MPSRISPSISGQSEVTAIIGPSGCGKSTLLRTFNRIYELYPDSGREGEILLDGENIFDPRRRTLNLLRSTVGMVFQQPTPFPMTIFDNIAFGIKLFENLNTPPHAPAGGMGSSARRPCGMR